MATHSKRFIALLGAVAVCWVQAAIPQELTNRLRAHPSPYLRMHADDPVAWQDWNSNAIELARRGDKLLYLSIGYFSCHWCHVMQRESYQDEKIATLLNESFVPIKVDRELEPALDAQMIDFVQSTQGRGGWPLNVFITPLGDPLYAVLYMQPDEFRQMLARLRDLWERDPENLAKLAQAKATTSGRPGEPALDPVAVRGFATKAVAMALQSADPEYGGFGDQQKFPSVPQLEFLLARYAESPSPAVKQVLTLTLNNIANKGLQDHLGGGFFRYTVDREWETPHFEKMLYGNALLARLFLRAGEVLTTPAYREAALRTLDFMIADMATPSGAFIASFSAVDDQDIEGGFYLWNHADLEGLLQPDESRVLKLAWRLEGPMRIEAGYLPVRAMSARDIARQLQTTPDAVAETLTSARRKLLKVRRTERVLPADTKLLAGWNGLALASLAEAARITQSEKYFRAAQSVHDYLVDQLWDGAALRRAVDGPDALGQPSVEDYAYVAEGLFAWADLTGDPGDYAVVQTVIDQAWRRFYDDEGWSLAEDSLIVARGRQDVLEDGPMPSPSAVITTVSLKLADRYRDTELRDQALSALNRGYAPLDRAPLWFATQVGAMLLALEGVSHSAAKDSN